MKFIHIFVNFNFLRQILIIFVQPNYSRKIFLDILQALSLMWRYGLCLKALCFSLTSLFSRWPDHLFVRGISPQQLDKVHSPIGLEIEAQTPEEIAVSILAEIIKVRRSS